MLKTSGMVALLVLLAVGCGSGSRDSGPTGKLCPSSYDPLPVDMTNTSEKVNLDPSAKELVKYPGAYQYEGALIFYSDSKTGAQIYVGETRDKQDSTKLVFHTECVSGLKPYQFLSETLTGLTDMKVIEDPSSQTGVKIADIRARTYLLAFSDNAIIREGYEDKDSRFEAPNKVFDGKMTEYAFYKVARNDNASFKLRSKMVKGTVSVYLEVQYKRVQTDATTANMDPRDLRLKSKK